MIETILTIAVILFAYVSMFLAGYFFGKARKKKKERFQAIYHEWSDGYGSGHDEGYTKGYKKGRTQGLKDFIEP